MLLPALGLMLVLPVAAPQERAAVVDIRAASPADVVALKQAPGVQWWLEMGTRLVVGGERDAIRELTSSHRPLGEFDALNRSDLALRAIGCDRETAEGSLCFTLGRWTTAAEIDLVLEALPAVIARVRRPPLP